MEFVDEGCVSEKSLQYGVCVGGSLVPFIITSNCIRKKGKALRLNNMFASIGIVH